MMLFDKSILEAKMQINAGKLAEMISDDVLENIEQDEELKHLSSEDRLAIESWVDSVTENHLKKLEDLVLVAQ